MNRRRWLVTSSAAAGAGLLAGRSALAALPKRELEPAIRALPIRLHFNENPYGISPKARAATSAAFGESGQYDSPAMEELAALIAEQEKVPADHVFVASGSSEVLALAGLAYGLAGGEVVAPAPTFEGLTGYVRAVGGYVHDVPVNDKMVLDLDAMDRRTTGAVRLVFVCNPNNPTGTIVPGDKLRAFCESASRRAVVFVDEAYHEFVEDPSHRSMVSMVRDGHNVIVSRTASKIHGMAGLRIGFGIARPDIIRRLQGLMMSFPNVLAARAAIASYRDPEYQALSRSRTREAKRYLYGVLDDMKLKYVPSHTNFVLFHTGKPIQAVHKAMLEKGVMVGRPFPPFMDWCRVSMGTMDEMKLFASAFREVMRA
ncbi:MAG: histidinol-phosphate aminotransferase family protein [Anaerolineae bacterium]|nr:histidinol-phosphate aminotransferase family protein [Gemmatimonadaceae bacterium]